MFLPYRLLCFYSFLFLITFTYLSQLRQYLFTMSDYHTHIRSSKSYNIIKSLYSPPFFIIRLSNQNQSPSNRGAFDLQKLWLAPHSFLRDAAHNPIYGDIFIYQFLLTPIVTCSPFISHSLEYPSILPITTSVAITSVSIMSFFLVSSSSSFSLPSI